jgi:hypothetical protein
MSELCPDREQINTFVEAVFRHVGTEGYVSIRSFHEEETAPYRITATSLASGLSFVCEVAADDAYRAANNYKPAVFCPPLAGFKTEKDAKQNNLLAGPVLSVECDKKPTEAAAKLETLLGPPTVIVRSGGQWTDPESGQIHDKLHLHWRLAKPARGQDLARLKEARALATELVEGDTSNVPLVHPIRWPGSWHRKGAPRLCEIETLNADAEIDLNTALNALEGAAPKREKKQANGSSQDGDWTTLIKDILDSQNYHDPLNRLAVKMLKAGMDDGAAINMLRGLMENVAGEDRHTKRWKARFNDIPRAVETAREFLKEQAKPAEPPPAKNLDEVHAVFRKWFGEEYDMDAIDAVLAAAAAEKLTGDPLWLLIVSGPGAAKTETVQALGGCGAHVTSTIHSEGALLSATKARGKGATGGLLRKIGDSGLLVIKDVTSILSSDRNVRAGVLAALREIYDGRWERNVGTGGGQTLTWVGRIGLVGAVTTAWDTHHSVLAVMGDRFVLIRIDSNAARKASGARAVRNTGEETQMRAELAAAVGGVIHHASQVETKLNDDEQQKLLNTADIVTKARTAVERDYAGEVIDAHAPEMPTRFTKQLAQFIRGGVAIGMSRQRALDLAIRCARDSVPPLRLAILLDLALHPHSRPADVRRRINKPWRTVKRELEGLNMLGLVRCDEEPEVDTDKTVWRYRLHEDFDRETLLTMAKVPSAEVHSFAAAKQERDWDFG